MKKRWRVWQAANSFAYAGTERAMAAWCLDLDPRQWQVSAYARLSGGPRLAQLRAQGRRARVLGPEPAAWRAELKRNPCDLLHIHRHGESDPGWDAVIQAAREAGVRRVVQTNVFGAQDRRGLGPSLDHHFYMSAMCLWRWAGWPRLLPAGHLQRHSVLYNPLRLSELPGSPVSASARNRARRALGIPLDAFVLGRLGRPDINKWPAWLPRVYARFARLKPRARLLLMEAPPGIEAELEALGVRDKALLLPARPDWAGVLRVYQALDCLAHGSRVGESFGYTLAEAQALGLPVLCDSTPWADNAQVELITHGQDGLIAGRPQAYLQALLRLEQDPALGRRLGERAFKSSRRRFNAKALAHGLGRHYRALLAGKPVPEAAWQAGFGRGYHERLERREAPDAWRDRAWALASALRLYWRGWASRALKFWRWGRA
jgi:glycosyltransferase involved in cell wall biosynthesis